LPPLREPSRDSTGFAGRPRSALATARRSTPMAWTPPTGPVAILDQISRRRLQCC